MKLLKYSFLLILISVFAVSCAEDDSDDTPFVCEQPDWVGTYTGTVVCDGVSEDATINITASGTDNITISYITAGGEAEFSNISFDACTLNATLTMGGFTAVLDGKLDGNSIDINETISNGTTSDLCVIKGTK